jgi:hypothetical protein
MIRPALIDLSGVPEEHCEGCLEDMVKALAEPGAHDDTIWSRHENPWIAGHVEAVTRRLQAIIQKLQDAFARLLLGEPIGELRKAEDTEPWHRWDVMRFEEVVKYLRAKPHEAWSLDDWLLAAEYIVQRYLPDGVIQTEAEYMVVRAALLGKIQAASVATPLRPDQMNALAEFVPTTFAAVPPRVLTPVEIATVRIARARAASAVTQATEGMKGRMRGIVLEHVQAMVLGQREGSPERLKTRLFDNFGQFNRDCRRIAVTECGEAMNQGFISTINPGQQVKRMEAYRGACPFCARINGKIFTVVSPTKPFPDGDTEVWEGKTNVGRFAAPMKRTAAGLVPRDPAELWWPAAGVQHPHCFVDAHIPIYTSGGWKPISEIAVGDSVLTHRGHFRPVTWVLKGVSHTGVVHGARATFNGRNKATLPATTGEHPVMTARGWVPSGQLVVGDKIAALAKVCPTCERPFINLKFQDVRYCSVAMNHDGAYVFGHLDVVALTRRKVTNAKLYNFAVAEDESYVAGGFVVHNCRGSWVGVMAKPPQVSQALWDFTEAELAKVIPKPPPPEEDDEWD